MHYAIAIPARLASVRLPEKLLLADTGKTLLVHTIERGQEAVALLGRSASEVVVVCDHERLAQAAEQAGASTIMTGDCASGTERIVMAIDEIDEAEVIVNLQADEPEMPAGWIVDCANALSEEDHFEVATVTVPLAAEDPALNDPNVVKVVIDHHGRALYFSRAAIPHVRDGGVPPEPRALRHIGLYAYRRSFLTRFRELPESDLEASECLEQLRFLQAGVAVRVVVKPAGEHVGGGIDTAADYKDFVHRIRG